MDVHCIDPTRDARWRELTQHPHAGLFHSPAWLQCLTDTYGFPVQAYIAVDAAGTVAAGIPFCAMDDMVGRRVACLPFTDACDPLVVAREGLRALLARLMEHRVPLQLRLLDQRIPAAEGDLQVTKRARWHRLAVTEPEALLWSGVAAAARRAIRKSGHAGVEVRPLPGIDGLHDFLRLHTAVRKHKYRLLPQPDAFFESIMQRFGETGDWHPLGAYLDGRLIAATIYLRWRDRLYYKFNASARDALAARPNNLLVWKGMLMARTLGCATLDLGPSDDAQPGLIRFKRDMGAIETELQFLRWAPVGWEDARGADARRMLGEITGLLTAPEVPDEVTRGAGTALYRYFA